MIPGRKIKKQNRSTKRLDLTSIKEALRDERCWACLAVVQAHDSGQYFEIIEDDVLVQVVTMPDQNKILARLGAPGSGSNSGVWSIPKSGSEVIVVVPSGRLEFQPVIVACYSSGGLPDGVAENVTVIANGEVLVHDGDGGTEPLVKKSEFEAHVHGTGVGPSSTPSAPITGTTVLKAK